jgi:hypothetical protein
MIQGEAVRDNDDAGWCGAVTGATIKVVRDGGKTSHDEVGVIRGGGGASDA